MVVPIPSSQPILLTGRIDLTSFERAEAILFSDFRERESERKQSKKINPWKSTQRHRHEKVKYLISPLYLPFVCGLFHFIPYAVSIDLFVKFFLALPFWAYMIFDYFFLIWVILDFLEFQFAFASSAESMIKFIALLSCHLGFSVLLSFPQPALAPIYVTTSLSERSFPLLGLLPFLTDFLKFLLFLKKKRESPSISTILLLTSVHLV